MRKYFVLIAALKSIDKRHFRDIVISFKLQELRFRHRETSTLAK